MKYSYSIVLPYRDKYDMFLKAIDSVPDREDIQIIIVDNAPKPLEEEKIPSKNKAAVTYLTSSPTKGAGCARNVGLQYVEGKHLLFLDADDFFTTSAFNAFDKYLCEEYDIVFFCADSINLITGLRSVRHEHIEKRIEEYLQTKEEGLLRYGIVNPVAKMFKTEFVFKNNIKFDETSVSNDVWFSMMTGHFAKHITASKDVVYMITEGDNGSSLTKSLNKDNWFIRFQVMVKVNKFLKEVNAYKYHTRLSGFLRVAWKEFGFKEFLHFLKYAVDHRVCIF